MSATVHVQCLLCKSNFYAAAQAFDRAYLEAMVADLQKEHARKCDGIIKANITMSEDPK